MRRRRFACIGCGVRITAGDECEACREAREIAHQLNLSATWRD